MTALCEHHGVSRRVAYKWVNRFNAEGVDGLKDRSRAPRNSPNKLSPEIVAAARRLAIVAHPLATARGSAGAGTLGRGK